MTTYPLELTDMLKNMIRVFGGDHIDTPKTMYGGNQKYRHIAKLMSKQNIILGGYKSDYVSVPSSLEPVIGDMQYSAIKKTAENRTKNSAGSMFEILRSASKQDGGDGEVGESSETSETSSENTDLIEEVAEETPEEIAETLEEENADIGNLDYSSEGQDTMDMDENSDSMLGKITDTMSNIIPTPSTSSSNSGTNMTGSNDPLSKLADILEKTANDIRRGRLDTPTETPAETPAEPTETPEGNAETPAETPAEPTETPAETPAETPEGNAETPVESPETPTENVGGMRKTRKRLSRGGGTRRSRHVTLKHDKILSKFINNKKMNGRGEL
jgi:hypothetical protein